VRKNPRKPRALAARFERFECRRLLSDTPFTISGFTQDRDFVGPNASVGADGIADVHLTLGSLNPYQQITSAQIVGTLANDSTHQLHWSFGYNPYGNPSAMLLRVKTDTTNAQFPSFQDNSLTTGDLYLSPPPAGQTLTSLSIKLYYNSNNLDSDNGMTQTATFSNSQSLASISPTLAAPGESIPASVLIPQPGGQAHFVEQYPTAGGVHAAGDVHVALDSFPAGYQYSNLVAAYLSDGIGTQTRQPGDATDLLRGGATWSWRSLGRTSVEAYDYPLAIQSASAGAAADITFPPVRDEAGTKMTLRMVVQDAGSGVQHSYYTQFVGGMSNVALRDTDYDHNAPIVYVSPTQPQATNHGLVTYQDPVSGTTTTSTLQSLIANATGHFDRIHLDSGVYSIDPDPNPLNSALTFGRPVQLIGAADAVLTFTADSRTGTKFKSAIFVNSSHVTLSNFQIRFSNPLDFDGSVIYTSGIRLPNSVSPQQIVDVNLTAVDIQGPQIPAFFVPGLAGKSRLEDVGRDGVLSQLLLDSHSTSGTITGCTLRGGGASFQGGPLQISGNHYIGTVPTFATYPGDYATSSFAGKHIPTYADWIFFSDSPHDQVFSGNTAAMSPVDNDPSNSLLGTAYRFVLYKTDSATGYHNTFQGNIIGNGVGRRSDDETTNMADSPDATVPGAAYHNTQNFPEMFLNETYKVEYEGRTLAIPTDGRVLSIPPPETTSYRQTIIAGDVVAILTGPDAGHWRRIAQVLATSVFLMDDPMPTGVYSISISRGLVDTWYDQNQVDLRNTTSTAFNIIGNQFDPRVTGNTIIGDYTTVIDGQRNYKTNQAILLESQYVDTDGDVIKDGYVYPFPTPNVQWTHTVIFGAKVTGNQIDGPLGGIQIDVTQGAASSIGRTYLSADVENNHFYDYGPQPNPGTAITADTSSVLTVGTAIDQPHQPTLAQVQHYRAYALLDANGRVMPNVDQSLGYSPASDSTTSFYQFADPAAIRVTLIGNWVQPITGSGTSKNQRVISAIVKSDPTQSVGTPIVYSMSAATSALPTTPPNPTTPLNYQFVQFGTPASSGFTAVDPGTQEGTTRSYGFVAPFSNDQNGQVNSGGDGKTEVYGSDMTFQVDLPNGSYLVNASLVPDGMPSDAKYYLQGIQLGTLSGASNQGVAVGPFVAVVVDGRLRLRITESLAAKQSNDNVAIETLSIRPLSFVFGDGSVAAPAGTAAVVNGQPTPPGTQFVNLASDTNALPGSIYSNDLTFEVNLPNGVYDVTPTFGSGASNPMDFTRVYLQDTTNGQVDALSLASNAKDSPTYLVDVVDGQLRIRLYAGTNGSNNPLPLAYIQALKIAPHKAALGFLFGQGGQQLAAGFDSVTQFTSYSAGLGYGIVSTSGNVNAAAGQVFGSPLVFQIDLPNGGYLVTPTLGAQSGASSTTSVDFGSGADYLATGAGAQDKSYVVTVANGQMTLTLIAAGGDPVAHLMGLSIIPLNSLPIVDPGFESIAITDPSGYAVAPADPYWKYSSPTGSSTGVFSNTTTVFASPPAAPDGKQAAFLQDIGAFWQKIANWQTGYYTISFRAAQRAGLQTPEEILVKFDNTVIYDITPSGTGYAFYSTNPFWVAAGSHTITFVGVNSSGDSMVFIDAIQALVVPALQDPSFETPSASNSQGDYLINPLYSDWSFVGTSGNSTGVSGNGTAITTGDGSAPNGSQVAFIQDDGAITQSVPGWAAGTYSISFLAAQRSTQTATTLESFQVLVDGLLVGTFTPSGATYTNYATAPFTVTAGSHVVTFQGVDPAGGDRMALLDLVGIQLQVQTIPTVLDPGFESVVVNPGNFTAAPAGSPWTFTNATGSGTGVSGTNTAGVTSGEPTSGVNGDGTQVAFIQDQGSISQSVSGWAAGAYRISFRAAQRASSNQTAPEQFQVLVDGVVVGDTITPSQGAGYTYFVTAPFLVDDSNTTTPGKHTITFKGLNPTGDCMVLIDQVQITPE